jgi:RNA polymerase sigma-70 factor (ECF subfamily)
MDLCWTIEMSLDSTSPADHDENRLVAASRGGDREAFSTLVRLHQRRVFRLAGRFFLAREDVEDVAQEAFLAAWSKLDSYQGRAPFEHWLTRICLNCCYARLRKRRPVDLPLEHDIESHAADPNARLEVERLLRRLKPEDRFILLLLDGEEWSVADIAERLGWTRVNVKVRAHRARKMLRRLLEREGR